MKDEMSGKVISEFVGLKSKMYSLVTVDGVGMNKAKCLKKSMGLCYDEFYVLFGSNVVKHTIKSIQAKKHKLGTYDVCKISLSCFDDKKYLLVDGVSSSAYGHKDIMLFFCLFDLVITL